MSMYAADVQILQSLTTHTSDVNAVDFAGDNILVTGSSDKKVRVWEWQLGSGFTEAPFSPLLGHKYGVTCVKVSPQSTMLASASIDGTTQLWNLRTGSKIHTMVQAAGEAVRICKFSPDSSLLVTAGDNGQVCLWDLVRRTLIRSFQKHEGAIQSLAITPDSNWLLTSCTLGVLQLFYCNEIIESCPSRESDLNVFAQIDDAHDLGVVCCDFSNVQEITNNEPFAKLYQLVTCGNDNRVKLWEVKVTQDKCDTQPMSATIELCRIMEKHSSALTCVRFSNNGLYTASSGLDKTVVIWETSTGRVVSVLTGHNRYVACCAFSKNGNFLATGSNDKKVIVWDLTGNLSLDSELVRHSCVKLQNSETLGKEFIHESDVVKHAETGGNEVTLIQRLDDHNGAVNSVAMFGNRLIASGSGDKLVRIWNVKYDEEGESTSVFQEMSYNPLDGHKYSVNYVEFSPCGTKVASCSMDGNTVIWDVEDVDCLGGSRDASSGRARECYMLATCGNDSLIKLWKIIVIDDDLELDEGTGSSSPGLSYRERRQFSGHGGNVMCVRFSPVHGEILGSVATDRTARLWSVHTGMCLHVLENHESLVTTCAFSEDTSIFLTGALDKTVLVWKLPDQLVSQSILIDRLRNYRKKVADWSVEDVVKWLHEVNLGDLSRSICTLSITGRMLLRIPEDVIIGKLMLDNDQELIDMFRKHLYWLKCEDSNTAYIVEDVDIPDDFLCPITHEIMREPVQCSDGFTYERAAINEWFLCGKFTSPMTNEPLKTTSLTTNVDLRNAIFEMLHGDGPASK
ncbi:WD repeat, SAM and U-box domain-containing protein 1-like [Copidosoma floridanum]|uniref:WD repeat, SAM and U-box domain-containing protein 1-like n=1 Tax=Copidosoma floridanum TaxID=29053 RepID=UPI000C6F65E1|nr:WD repeat, SAM and U-box domain-containing protein 1-like [Copidosoma floridanum]